jgi:hypothetical protein
VFPEILAPGVLRTGLPKDPTTMMRIAPMSSYGFTVNIDEQFGENPKFEWDIAGAKGLQP